MHTGTLARCSVSRRSLSSRLRRPTSSARRSLSLSLALSCSLSHLSCFCSAPTRPRIRESRDSASISFAFDTACLRSCLLCYSLSLSHSLTHSLSLSLYPSLSLSLFLSHTHTRNISHDLWSCVRTNCRVHALDKACHTLSLSLSLSLSHTHTHT